MLDEFVTLHRDDIVTRVKGRLQVRSWPLVSAGEAEHGVPVFLAQLVEELRMQGTPAEGATIAASASRHGAELLAAGLTVAQVVYGYRDICQTIIEMAAERQASIALSEFQTLDRCLDIAMAAAVTEHTRLAAEARATEEVERLGQVAHELRDLLNAAMLAYQALQKGRLPIDGGTGAVLGRSLTGLWAVVDRTLSHVRLGAAARWPERLPAITFIDHIAATAILHAADKGILFRVEPVAADVAIEGDGHLLTSAVMNLLHNAFKHTPSGGTVVLRAFADGEWLTVEVQDECGGIAGDTRDLVRVFAERSGTDRSGLGLGLSIAQRAVRASGGHIAVRNLPGAGCVFAIHLPLATDERGAARRT